MKFIRFTQIAALLVLVAGSARAADAWAQLKLGMTSIQAVAVVGAPLQRSSGQGFQVWTYDNRAELVFYGPLIGWTTHCRCNGAFRRRVAKFSQRQDYEALHTATSFLAG
jgi:hypothetical protein